MHSSAGGKEYLSADLDSHYPGELCSKLCNGKVKVIAKYVHNTTRDHFGTTLKVRN